MSIANQLSLPQQKLSGTVILEPSKSISNRALIIRSLCNCLLYTSLYGRTGKPIKAKTKNQKKMVTACDLNDVVFAVGPAGTGKTYTAVALAVRALKNAMVKKIILTLSLIHI